MYAKWFHWILSEFIGYSEWDLNEDVMNIAYTEWDLMGCNEQGLVSMWKIEYFRR